MNPQLTQLRVRRQTVVKSDQPDLANARLRGGWLVFARICWLALAALALIVFASSLPPYFTNLQQVCNSYSCSNGQLMLQSAQVLQNLGVSAGLYAVFVLVLTIAMTIVWFVVGGVIFWRKSDEWVALLVSLSLVLFAGSGALSGLVSSNSAWTVFVSLFQFLGNTTFLLTLFLFPDGRFAPRWMALLAVMGTLYFVDSTILPLILPNSPFIPWNWPVALGVLVYVGLFGGLAFSQLYRYRRISTPAQRQRTRWVVFAFLVVLLGPLGELLVLDALPQIAPALHAPDPLYQSINFFVWNLSPVLIPLSFGIAILRSRLWDIDIIINRTLVYTTLTGTLAVVYIACILILQALLSGFTSGNAVALVGSTLGIASLFRPFRRRIQTIIDRRFYRRKYDGARTIAAFSASLRGEVDLNMLSEQLVAVVQETMQPTSVSLWLQQHDRQGQLQYKELVTPELAPSREPAGPISETEVTEKSAELPGPSPRKISRRPVLIGLATGGVVVAGGGFSWWLLRRRATFTYTGHSDWVYDVAWSPDGKRIASCSKDKTVQVWDATDGDHVLTYRGHTDTVVTVAWSPDGTRLASGGGNLFELNKSNDKTVQVWNASDGDHIFTYTGHTDWVSGVAWSPDSRRIASASSDKTVQVWDALNGGHVYIYNGHSNYVVTAAWSPDGTRIASASYDDTVQIWSPG